MIGMVHLSKCFTGDTLIILLLVVMELISFPCAGTKDLVLAADIVVSVAYT